MEGVDGMCWDGNRWMHCILELEVGFEALDRNGCIWAFRVIGNPRIV